MKFTELDLALEVDVYNEDGTMFVSIADENSTGVTYEVGNVKQILDRISDYIEDYMN